MAKTLSCPNCSGSVGAVTQREFDLVLYGATGFAGKLTAEYLARAGGAARIALAGRSEDRLRAVRDTLGAGAQDWPLLTADASAPSTLDAMAARTHVVVTTVGPIRNTACRWWPRAPRLQPTTPISPARRCSSARASTSFTSRLSTPVPASSIRVHSIPSHQISPPMRCTGGPRPTVRASSATPIWWCAISPPVCQAGRWPR